MRTNEKLRHPWRAVTGRALVLGLLALPPGCNRSHEARDDGGAPPDAPALLDAGPRDAAPLDAAPLDAGPVVGACRVACEPLQRLEVPPETSVAQLLGTAVIGRTLGVLVSRRGDDDDQLPVALLLVDLDSRRVTEADAVLDFEVHRGYSVASLQAEGDTFVASQLATDTPPRSAAFRSTLRSVAWGTDGRVRWQVPTIAPMPTVGACACTPQATIAGAGGRSFVALAEGDTLWLTRFPPTASAVALPESLRQWPDARAGSVPTSLGVVRDGRASIAVGGRLLDGASPRAASLVMELPSGRTREVALPGERFDPPPVVATDELQTLVMRYVTNPRDAGASALVARRYALTPDDEIAQLEEVRVPLEFGLEPTALAPFPPGAGGGFVWASTPWDLHVLPAASDWSACEGAIAPAPITALRTPLLPEWSITRSLAVQVDAGGAVLVVALVASHWGPVGLEVLRIPGCRLVPSG